MIKHRYFLDKRTTKTTKNAIVPLRCRIEDIE